ncbi:MAG TPA: beta-N-acetylhexosaminidase, partial [Bacteroidales bacterium]|nr:beta-N-acetylhexosaminidase [Bacteroidales bacterium]
MKIKIQVLSLLLLILSTICFGQNSIDIIPQPVSVKLDNSSKFLINNNTKIICNIDSKEYSVAEYLHSQLQAFNPSIKPILPKKDNPKYNIANSIIFVLSSDKILGKEGYQIDIMNDRIILFANENAGFFYGCQTIIQMIMSSWSNDNISAKESFNKEISTGRIIDYPRFAYRGKHLDCARHFFSKEEVKQYIDLLAFHKLNTFHWHLTDDQGWRVEIKKYPKLQTIASKRKETLIGHYSDNPIKYDGKEYVGYYTQEDIKEIVEYAKQRYINI